MNSDIKQVLESKKPFNRLYLGLTGGGTLAISRLLENGGASSVFMGAIVPYCEDELRSYVGSYSKAVSIEVAKRLSKVGFTKSFSDDIESPDKCVGIGVTASLGKDNEREGREHKFCIAVSSFDNKSSQYAFSCEILLKEKRTRKQEEEIVADLIIALANCYMNLTKPHPITMKTWYNNLGFTDNDKINNMNFWEKEQKLVEED